MKDENYEKSKVIIFPSNSFTLDFNVDFDSND